MKNKKSFLLLELLIACFIVFTLIFPLILSPYKMVKRKSQEMLSLELHRQAHLMVASLREKMYKEPGFLDAIPTTKPKKKDKPFYQEKGILSLAPSREFPFEAKVYIWCAEEKIAESQKKSTSFIHLVVEFPPHKESFPYAFTVQKSL